MNVELRTPGLKLPRSHSTGLLRQVREAFAQVANRIARIVLRVAPVHPAHPQQQRECLVEIHLADGHVERVQERQRRLGALLRRALSRAAEAAARRIMSLGDARALPPLEATFRPALPPTARLEAMRDAERT